MKLYILMVLFIFVQDCDFTYLLKMVLQCIFTDMKSGHCSHSLWTFAFDQFSCCTKNVLNHWTERKMYTDTAKEQIRGKKHKSDKHKDYLSCFHFLLLCNCVLCVLMDWEIARVKVHCVYIMCYMLHNQNSEDNGVMRYLTFGNIKQTSCFFSTK